MLELKTSEKVLKAVNGSPDGIAQLDVLMSLQLCGRDTLKTTLCRLAKTERVIRLRRGVYSANPVSDAYLAAQAAYGGYIGFSSALHLHGLAAEMPFTITIVTASVSARKAVGQYEFLAVALGEKAVGAVRLGKYCVSSRAKTLFDCLCLPRYGVEKEKLVLAFKEARLADADWREFDGYVEKYAPKKRAGRMKEAKALILR